MPTTNRQRRPTYYSDSNPNLQLLQLHRVQEICSKYVRKQIKKCEGKEIKGK